MNQVDKMNKNCTCILMKYLYISLRATLNKTFTAEYSGVLPRTPKVKPKSEIYSPKRDDEHPPFILCPSREPY